MGLVTEIIDAMTDLPVASLAKAVFNVFDKHIKLGNRFWDYMRQRKLDETEMAKITRMDPEKGIALQSLGDLQARLSDHDGAMESYRSCGRRWKNCSSQTLQRIEESTN